MTDEQIELARRAVACRGWRWMPGMLVDSGGTIYRMTEKTIALGCGSPEFQREYMRPDLTDPATLGCLLALVREAWGDDAIVAARADALEVFVAPLPGGFAYEVMLSIPPYALKHRFLTEAEALVAALEAAPCGQ